MSHLDLVPSLADWSLLAFLLVLVPPSVVLRVRRLRSQVASGDAGARIRFYRGVILEQWIFAAVLLGCWFSQGRSSADLGLTVGSGTGALFAWGAALLAAVLLGFQMRAVETSASFRDVVRSQLEGVGDLTPSTRPELRSFWALSLTAGVWEEVVYRGFAMGVLGAFAGPWVALVGSVVLFTAGHAYQPSSLHRVAAIAVLTAGLYWLGGTLFPLVILHVAIDVSSGWISWRVARDEAAP